MKRAWRGAKWTAIVVFASLVAGALSLMVVYPRLRGPGVGREVDLVLTGAESIDALAVRLRAAGLVSSPRIFALYARARGVAHAARGAHLLVDNLSAGELLARLERRGRGARVKVTIPEGFTRFDIARRLEALRVASSRALLDTSEQRGLLEELNVSGDSLEGFLFPATYEFPLDSDPASVLRRMKTEFDRRYMRIAQTHASGELYLSQALGWGMQQVVILASIVEKEAAVDEERPVVASVFLNRMLDPNFKSRFLQSDPTSGYGCLVLPTLPACYGYRGHITHDMNADPDNSYSTYTHEGLPPGPIANPGAKSIEAVLDPAITHYFYFVARGDGHHIFSETYEAHDAAVHERARR